MFRPQTSVGRIGITIPMGRFRELHETHFRGTHIREAGNFCRWNSFYDMTHDRSFTDRFCEVAVDVIHQYGHPTRERNYTEYITLQLEDAVGWTSIIPRMYAQDIRTERRPLNERSEALFIADQALLAPLTNIITFEAEFRYDLVGKLDTLILLHSLYPGPGTGPLVGDMTKKTDLMWFNQGHPGGERFINIDL